MSAKHFLRSKHWKNNRSIGGAAKKTQQCPRREPYRVHWSSGPLAVSSWPSEGGAGELDGRHVRRGMCIIRTAIRILDTGTNKTVAASVTRIFGRQALTSATASQAFRNPNRGPYRKR